jgi:hypothetical protein
VTMTVRPAMRYSPLAMSWEKALGACETAYPPECVEGLFCELRPEEVLRSSYGPGSLRYRFPRTFDLPTR